MSATEESFLKELALVRPTTRNVIESVLLDGWPNHTAIVDFGIDSQQHYEALYYPIRAREISPQALDAALGYGAKLTALARAAPANPHKKIEFHTSWDVAFGRGSKSRPPSEPQPSPTREPGRSGRSRGRDT